MIEITDPAKTELKKILQENEGQSIRVLIAGYG
jgi:hypothetical protein